MAIEWVVSTVTGRVSDGKVTEVHWRHGTSYGVVNVDGNRNSNFVALAKSALGAARVAVIEAQEALRLAINEAPEIITVNSVDFDDATKIKPSKQKQNELAAAVVTLQSAENSLALIKKTQQDAQSASKDVARIVDAEKTRVTPVLPALPPVSIVVDRDNPRGRQAL